MLSPPVWAAGVLVVSLFAGPCDVDGELAQGSAPQVPAERFVAVEVSNEFGCALRDDGVVRCWGFGPASVSPTGEFSALSAGTHVVCGIRLGGEIDCWGDDRVELLTPPVGEFSSVDVGFDKACGVRVDGGVACWGQRGRGPVPEGRFRAVAAYGSVATCGIGMDGTIVCWGGDSKFWVPPEGSFRSLGVVPDYGCGLREGGEAVCWGPAGRLCRVDDDGVVNCWFPHGPNDGQDSPPEGVFTDVAVSEVFSCGIRADGEAVCWGAEKNTECHSQVPCSGWGNDPIPPGPFVSIDVAPRSYYLSPLRTPVCGLRPDGRIDCWNDGSQRRRPPSGVFVAVDVGGRATCAIRVDGSAVCWGQADWLDSVPPGAFAAVSAAWAHGCGLRPGGEAECWGSNDFGEARPPPGRFTAIDTGPSLSCGLRPGGEVACWGRNTAGEAEPPPGPFNAIAAHGTYACGQRADATTECWGSTQHLTANAVARFFAERDPSDPAWGASLPGGTFSVIDSRGGTACGIRPSGAVECWNEDWPPGAGLADTTVPAAVPPTPDTRRGVDRRLSWVKGDVAGGPYAALDSGWYDTCGLRRDGSVECWGNNMTLSVVGTFSSVDVYSGAACGIGTDGRRRCWSLHARTLADPDVVAPIAPGEDVLAIQRGHRVHCVLLASGAIACQDILNDTTETRPGPFAQFSIGWGLVYDPDSVNGSMEPLPPNGFIPGHDVNTSRQADARTHVCAIRRDGSLDCWGSGGRGQTALPAPWRDDPPYRDIAAGFTHTCALGASGEAICWGDNRYGQLSAPPGPFTAVSAGQWHTCALRPDGEIDCWGNGPAAQAERYDEPPEGQPAQPPLGPFTAVSAGRWHTCALRPDGTATCWLSY